MKCIGLYSHDLHKLHCSDRKVVINFQYNCHFIFCQIDKKKICQSRKYFLLLPCDGLEERRSYSSPGLVRLH